MSVIEKCLLDKIAENPHNIRRDVGDLTELAASITTHGLLEPLVVAPTNDPDREPFVLIAGHRRLAAARLAGLTSTTVIVRPELDTVASQLEAMLVENLQRVDITPIEEGAAYTQLLAFDGVTTATIAKATGRSAATIKGRTALAALPDRVQAKVHHQEITLADAMAMTEWLDDPAALAELERGVGTYSFAHSLSNLKRKKAWAATAKATHKALAKAGVPLVDKPSNYPWSSVEQPLNRLDLTPEQHATCPGHAAYIDQYAAAAQYLCTDATTHHVTDDTEPAEAPDPEVAAREAENERVRGVLRAATEIREAFAARFIDGSAKPPKDVLAVALAFIAVELEMVEAAAAAAGFDLKDEFDAYAVEDQTWFIAQVLRAKPDALNRLLFQIIASLGEGAVPRYGNSTWDDPLARTYLPFLIRAGYLASPEELASIADPADA